MTQYHHLDYTPMSDQQQRCIACTREQLVALIGSAAATGKLA
jgi:hypothetical protein